MGLDKLILIRGFVIYVLRYLSLHVGFGVNGLGVTDLGQISGGQVA